MKYETACMKELYLWKRDQNKKVMKFKGCINEI